MLSIEAYFSQQSPGYSENIFKVNGQNNQTIKAAEFREGK
jgi:hypothetical protein